MNTSLAKTQLGPAYLGLEQKARQYPIRRLLTVMGVGLLALAADVARANLLFNGNLDQISISSQINASPTGWTIDASKTISGAFFDGADSETFCNVADTGGYGLFFKPFQGDVSAEDLLTVNFYQDNPATPGTKFTLSFYAAAEANYSGFLKTNTPNPGTFAIIEFLDSTGTPLVTNAFDLVAAGLPNGGPGSMSSF